MPIPTPSFGDDSPVGVAARIVQTALAPVFLLNGIGTLLGLFNTRIARVRDHASRLDELLDGRTEGSEEAKLLWHRRRLNRRVFCLDLAIVLGAIAGAATCGSVFVLFLGDVKGFDVATWLIDVFGLALFCILLSLLAFLADSLLAWHAFRTEGATPRSTEASRQAG